MKLSDIAKKMIFILGISLLVVIAISAIYYRSWAFFPFALGALLGVALNIFKVIMLDRTVEKVVDMDAKKAGNYVTVQHFLRFALTGVVLVLAAVLPFVNFWGAVAGVLTFQIATFSMKHFTEARKPSNEDTTA